MLQPIKISIYNHNAHPPSEATCVLIRVEIHIFFLVFSFRNHLFRLHLEDLSLIQVGEKSLCLSLSVYLFSRIAQTAQTPRMRLTGVAAAMCECQLQWLHKLREKDSANLKVVNSAQCWRDWRSCPVGWCSLLNPYVNIPWTPFWICVVGKLLTALICMAWCLFVLNLMFQCWQTDMFFESLILALNWELKIMFTTKYDEADKD